MSYHLTPVRMAILKRQEVTSVGKDVVKQEPLCPIGENVNWGSHYGKQDEGSPK